MVCSYRLCNRIMTGLRLLWYGALPFCSVECRDKHAATPAKDR
jgi:hypothetical protein